MRRLEIVRLRWARGRPRELIEELLRSYDNAASFMDSPASGLAAAADLPEVTEAQAEVEAPRQNFIAKLRRIKDAEADLKNAGEVQQILDSSDTKAFQFLGIPNVDAGQCRY